MKISKFARIAIASAVVLSVLAPSAKATVFPGFPKGSDRQALSILDLPGNAFSFITNIPFAQSVNAGADTETPTKTRFCDEFNTRGCNLDANGDLRVSSVIPVCETAVENCIDILEITKSDGTVVPAKFVRYFKGKTFTAPAELGMPGGSRVSLWQATGATNGGGTDLYAVNTTVMWRYQNGGANFQSFNASVYPVKVKSDARYKESGIWTGNAFAGVYGSVTETGEILYDGSCAAVEVGACAEKVEFTPGARVKLVMKLSNKVTGWLHGRIAKPDIAVTPIDDRFNTLSVSADVVDVPMMYAAYNTSEMSEDFKRNFNSALHQGRGLFGISYWDQFSPSSEAAANLVTALADSVKNTATESHSYWNLSSLPNPSMNKCLSDTSKLIGFVTTNAMAYSGNTPTWNGESLEYKVAGLHFLPDGKTPTSGTYDLAIRSETARCLYGFTKAPISAAISVTSSDGEQKVATTVLNEKDGWLYLAAYGFSFSSPTIKIKLTQEQPKEAASSSAVAKAQALKTIKCVKGKTVKSVKGVNPKCPAGYKAK